MLDIKISGMLNNQVNKELYSAYLYLHFSKLLAEQALDGFSNWFYIQAQEELEHAMMFAKYLQSNGGKLSYESIPKPEIENVGVKDIVFEALAHEQSITESIYHLCAATETQQDFRTRLFLNWFVQEQGEEEETTKALVHKVDVFGTEPKGLYLLDQELGRRTYHPHHGHEG